MVQRRAFLLASAALATLGASGLTGPVRADTGAAPQPLWFGRAAVDAHPVGRLVLTPA